MKSPPFADPAVKAVFDTYEAPLRASLLLCGSMFGLRSQRGYLRRHRLFECSVLVMAPCPCRHEGLAIGVYGHGSAGLLGQRMRTANANEGRVLMDMPWSTRDGLSQAIPPAYTEHIGKALMCAIQAERMTVIEGMGAGA